MAFHESCSATLPSIANNSPEDCGTMRLGANAFPKEPFSPDILVESLATWNKVQFGNLYIQHVVVHYIFPTVCQMDGAEIFSALGTPARTAARALLAPRYAVNGFQPLREWVDNEYAQKRYGPWYMWRVWLLFDCEDLEMLENLINDGGDDEVLQMRDAKLKQFKLVTLVGALLATLALQALSLPVLEKTTFFARANFIVSTMLSLLATFFTLIQQREVGVIRDARSFRRWLSNGVQYTNARERLVWQSSLTSLTLVEAPYELISLAVASFVAGMSAYVWGVWKGRLEAQQEQGLEGVAVVVYFAVATGFAFTMFPVLLGLKDREESAYHKSAEM